MHYLRDKAFMYLGAFLFGAVFLFLVTIVERGLPASLTEMLGRLAGGGLGGLMMFAFTDSRTVRRLFFALMVALVVAALIDGSLRGTSIRFNGWTIFGVSFTLGVVLVWAVEASGLVRRWFFGALAVSLLYPVTVILLPQMPLAVRLTLALGIAGAIGAWAGWRVWPAIERWHLTGWLTAREALRAGWQRGAAAAKGEMSAEDFLKRRDRDR